MSEDLGTARPGRGNEERGVAVLHLLKRLSSLHFR
jgi:hypothetical protein